MGMHFVAGTGAEVDDAQIEILACLRRQQRLPRHGTTREQRSVHGLGRDFGWFVYLHWSILLSGYRAYLASRGSVPASQCPCNGASGAWSDGPVSAAFAGGAFLRIAGITGL